MLPRDRVMNQAILNVKAHRMNGTSHAKPYVVDFPDEVKLTRVDAPRVHEKRIDNLPPLLCSIAGWIGSGDAREDMIGGLTEDLPIKCSRKHVLRLPPLDVVALKGCLLRARRMGTEWVIRNENIGTIEGCPVSIGIIHDYC